MDKLETQAVHAGQHIDSATGAVSTPLYLSTTYERDADGSYPRHYEYIREGNPNRNLLERSIALLEGGAAAAAFASGSTATMTLLQALHTGDHVVAPSNVYYGVRVMIEDIFAAWGLQSTFVDTTDIDALQQAIQPHTRLILIETPSNPTIKITDIAAVAQIAHQAGALLACDNTIATPALQHPFEHGADLVIHSTTKYISGHSDVMGGMIVTREANDLFERIRHLQKIGGAVAAPFDAWLTLRGLQTLPHRVRIHSENALRVAQFLHEHEGIEAVLYPGLESHPGHAIAREQMTAFGGLMSVLVRGGEGAAMALAANVRVFTRATSFGGTHSLIEHRASIEAPGSGTPTNLLRLSIGLEHADDLITDLDQALNAAR